MSDEIHAVEVLESAEVDENEIRRSDWWRVPIPWWLLAAIAIAVAELTAHPALGVVIFCVKFGLNDWHTATWLCRVDPRRKRSHTLWWFLMGSGCLKIFLMSSIVFPLLAGWWRVAFGQRLQHEVRIAVWVGVGGIGLSFVLTHIGIFLAVRRGVRVWLNRQLHQFRDENRWPLELTAPNRLRAILNGSAFPGFFGFALGGALTLAGHFRGDMRLMTIGGVAVAVSGAILLSHALSVKRIMARSPEECWSDLPELILVDDELPAEACFEH